MIIKQFFDSDIAHSSYIIGGKNRCAVVDPRRDIGIYLREAKQNNLKISHIFLTHLHADFISGHLDLKDRTKAEICGPAGAGFSFDHQPLKEGDTLDIEDLSFEIIETPGHSPEMVNYIVYDVSVNKKEPFGIFTGDTVFIGDVGRPDIFEERFDELSGKLFSSLQKVLKLPDHCMVFPAHGPGSFCGKAIGGAKTGTIGYERLNNVYLNIGDVEEFKLQIKKDMPPVPDHFKRLSEVNRDGPALMKDLTRLIPVDTGELKGLLKKEGMLVIDTRSYDSFSAQHIKNSYNIKLVGSFSSYAGWIVPPGAEIAIISETPSIAYHAYYVLRRMGFDRDIYYYQNGMQEWARMGNEVSGFGLIHPERLQKLLQAKEDMQLLDVRNIHEYRKGKIDQSINIPLHDLRKRYQELDRDKKTVVHCSSGLRSSFACSILMVCGFKDIYNLAGGYSGYTKYIEGKTA